MGMENEPLDQNPTNEEKRSSFRLRALCNRPRAFGVGETFKAPVLLVNYEGVFAVVLTKTGKI